MQDTLQAEKKAFEKEKKKAKKMARASYAS